MKCSEANIRFVDVIPLILPESNRRESLGWWSFLFAVYYYTRIIISLCWHQCSQSSPDWKVNYLGSSYTWSCCHEDHRADDHHDVMLLLPITFCRSHLHRLHFDAADTSIGYLMDICSGASRFQINCRNYFSTESSSSSWWAAVDYPTRRWLIRLDEAMIRSSAAAAGFS